MKKPKSTRQNRILSELDQSPSLRVAELAQMLAVSTETIRRDLDEMTDQGLLNRTYGGAVRSLGTEPSVTERHALFVSERERIARAAVPLLKDARVLMIGSGATTVHVARRIATEMKNITVITHAFGVATVLAINPTIDVVMLPGKYHPTEGATIGAHAVSYLQEFNADFAILGASGLGPDGPTDALLECGLVYRTMLSRSARSMVVADHSKHDRIFPARYAEWRDIDIVVTDGTVSTSLAERFREFAVQQVEC
ncbi:DeoR faimly transcriptional regulator [Agrobacterium sp. TS43]|uniref:DeoR/GlpR family DNA-binding transcription regulator n=1 Tax=Agrobacterium TaxID=357 RepID=UPI0004A0A87E|nr:MULTISPECIES: DeoR/GlpR family DNA-binding transcription regulator [Agrobacterium]KDR90333.1 DeoR faimly transcriptional regulator [Agrobacterium tumefaciens GW4]KVK52149.1 DeoR faimly transcriptional regulator [Agrobacterium sp. JL28]KVK53257.1 DeoR faimly transcriptional regulator [Agrobacterium sp. LY4]KVK64491.1 DeoR faimly transcriptional regulator [Agrobacterium sp. TS45]KVK65356.1 DeoR faimly transcriptional regulator [Agrobacterium sp. TS43]